MVGIAVVQTMPVTSARGTKRVMIDKLVEYVECGGHDKTVRYCKVLQGFTKRRLAEWLAVHNLSRLKASGTKDEVVKASGPRWC